MIMKTFSSGCAAMTGVEAVSNGVMAFREPRTKNAQWTLTVIIGLLHHPALRHNVPGEGVSTSWRWIRMPANYQSMLSILVRAITGQRLVLYHHHGLRLSGAGAFGEHGIC